MDKPTIEHIVITGGSTIILNAYGALRETHKNQVWQFDTIKSFHGTSAGSILAFMLALNYPWETMDKYLIHRPWKKLMNFNITNIYESFVGNGIFDGSFFQETYAPLLRGKDIDINITFHEFHKTHGKELYFYALNLTTFKTEELSHLTYPDMRIIDAVHASSALPILFKPFKYGTTIFSDGGIFSNYPMKHCLAKGYDPSSILGVHIKTRPLTISENMGILDYIIYLINMVLVKLHDEYEPVPNDISLDMEYENYESRYMMLESPIDRSKEIDKGVQDAQNWLNNHAVYKLL
jgi:predicted acylesterase/phospholipase RssA